MIDKYIFAGHRREENIFGDAMESLSLRSKRSSVGMIEGQNFFFTLTRSLASY
jgi:hypothetical protein